MKRKFAVFDIDGTFYRGSLFLDIVDQLISSGKLTGDITEQYQQNIEDWYSRKYAGAYNKLIRTMVEFVEANAENLLVADIEQAAREVIRNKHAYTYTFTRDLAKKLKAEGYMLIAISGSPIEAVTEFAKLHGFDHSEASIWHRTDDGTRYNGEFFTGAHDKHKIIERLIAEHGLTRTDSYAVGDSKGDISMLAMVDNPIAFNPEDALYEEAKAQGWRIVVERKSVVYELRKDGNGTYLLA